MTQTIKQPNYNPIDLKGNWKAGWALDLYTLPGYNHTELGGLYSDFKYYGKTENATPIIKALHEYMKSRCVTLYLDAIITVPPSKLQRSYQPVSLMAKPLGDLINIPAIDDYLLKVKKTEPTKHKSANERQEMLRDAFDINESKINDLKGKKVLLFDDIYDTGTTLNIITELLYNKGKVDNVYALTLLKTRLTAPLANK